MDVIYKVGIDIGSTTIKIVFVDEQDNIIFSEYQRHNADIKNAFLLTFGKALQHFDNQNIKISVAITGSAGMGISEKFGVPFIQEVVAAAELIKHKYPEINTLIDIGGEDAKMIFFHKDKTPDIRMNGSCAGGTGAFIDQMTSLLGISLAELNELASNYTNIYPIASRCGVFTKTDIQNLVAKNTKREDIAASIFNAVAMQTITSLARGYDINPKIFFCGGPFAFLPELKKFFARQLKLTENDYIISDNAQFIPAWGTAISNDKRLEISLLDFIEMIKSDNNLENISLQDRLAPLFSSKKEYEEWQTDKSINNIHKIDISEANENDDFFLGIDSGSTTTKIVIINSKDEVLFTYYCRNNGNSLQAIQDGLKKFDEHAKEYNKSIHIKKSAVTGYGEDLVKAAYKLDYGIVETIAHYTAAHKFQPKVSFILDIGGQDMKAIFVNNGAINKLEINEACSSGCGSFIEGFANSLNYPVAEFAEEACSADNPCDLGTRCTVFMNSKVKQFLREGAKAADLAAGISYSVIKNCLYKVLKLKDLSELGEHIVVQGGTFRNNSVVRALELSLDKKVIRSNMPELMGAYGAAIFAKENVLEHPVPTRHPSTIGEYSNNSPSLKGWQAKPDGVVINDIFIKFCPIDDLPYNPKLKDRAKELRKSNVLSEVIFWNSIKNKQFWGLDFDRQKVIGNYIVDFYLKQLSLIVEIDGISHNDKQDYDEERQKYLESLGLNVIRFNDNDIKRDLTAVIKYLENYIVEKYGINENKNTPSSETLATPLIEGNKQPVPVEKVEYTNPNSPSMKIGHTNPDRVVLPELMPYTTEQFNCHGCENQCLISKLVFNENESFVTGNKCEKVYTNKGSERQKGENHYNFKLKRLNQYIKPKKEANKLTIGIPRVLNMYENFPFWSELFTECGINVTLSRQSTYRQYEKGIGSVMADNICFPAKLVHGHVHDLLEMKVDRIFFPFVVYEVKEHPAVANSFNCPIVTGYGEVIKSSMDTLTKHNVPLDMPSINFDNPELLRNACYEYLSQFGIDKSVFNRAFDKAQEAFADFRNSLKQNCKRILDNAVAEDRIAILVAGRPYHTDQLIQHKLTDMIAEFGVDVISDDFVRLEDYSAFSDLNTVSQWTYTNRIMRAAKFVGESKSDMHFIEITSFGCGPDAFIIDEVGEILKSHGKNFTVLKVDDVNNIGSLKLRVRSLIESLKFNHNEPLKTYRQKKTPVYQESDKAKTILAPFFSNIYSPFLPSLFKLMGYNLINLPPSDEQSIEMGLRYANNEICYPATLVIGDVLKAVNSGNYDLDNIVIGMTQTGGQCRATNYIMLIKKALLAAGYEHIPVISVTFTDGLNDQQAFKLDLKPHIKITIYAVLFADAISKMYYSAAAHEKQKGQALALREKYINGAQVYVLNKDSKGLRHYLAEAAKEFNAIIDKSKNPAKIGIVGEIYVKYNSIGHKNIINWLVDNNIEVVVPPILSFFTQWFVNRKTNIEHNLAEKGKWYFLPDILKKILDICVRKVDKIASNYELWRPFGDIEEEAKEAAKVITLAAQFGEGWLIPAEISNFDKHGVKNVVSLQPFGCIANHIISKGIEKKIKQVFPKMNLLFLDFDSGVSDVNVHNRLHFMIKNAIE